MGRICGKDEQAVMKRNEYIRALRDALADMDHASRNEIIEEFERHFEEGVQNGLSEEEIAEELGDPREAAGELSGMQNHSRTTLRDLLSELTVSLRVSGREEESGSPETICGHSDDHFEKVVIHAVRASADMEIRTGERIEYIFRKGRNLFGTNNVRLETETGDDTFFLYIYDGHGDLDLTLPCCTDMLEIRNPNGDVHISEMNLVSADINCTNGDVTMEETDAEKLHLTVRHGDVTMSDVNSLNMVMEMNAGDLEMNRCSGNAEIQTAAGDIDIEGHSGEKISVSTKSGDIELVTDAPVISVTAVSGDIEISTPNRIDILEAHSVSGDIDLSLKDPEWCAELSTVSGDIENRTGKPELRSRKTVRIGEGNVNVYASTVSGDITADEY